MPDRVSVGEIVYPTYDGGASGLAPGIQITDKRGGAVLLARTSAGVAEQPAGGGSYDYTPGFTVPAGVAAFKVAWNNSAGQIVYTEDYFVTDSGATTRRLTNMPWAVGATVNAYEDVAVDGAGAPYSAIRATAVVAADSSVTFVGLAQKSYFGAASAADNYQRKVRFSTA